MFIDREPPACTPLGVRYQAPIPQGHSVLYSVSVCQKIAAPNTHRSLRIPHFLRFLFRYLFCPNGGMKTFKYSALRTLSFIILIAAEFLLSLIAVWLIGGHGVIACGKGIFDSNTWASDLFVIVGIPVLFIVGAGAIFFWSSSRLTAADESTSHS